MSQSFYARRSFVIVMVTVFLLPFLFVGSRRAMRSNRNDVKEWLPEGFQETADHHWFQSHFPHEQFVLVSWEGCTLNDPRLELFARKLVPEEVEAPADGEVADRFAPPAAEKPPEKPRLFNSVLTGPRLMDEMLGRHETMSEEDALDRLKGTLIGEDGLKTCLVVTLSEAAKGTNLRSTLEEIRRIAREECNIKEEEIRLGGPPVDNVAIDVEGERTLMRLALLSAIVGLGVSMVCFRSIRLTLIVFWIALLSAGLGLSLVYFTGSNVDAILLSMPTLVYVLAISGAVHIVNYYHDAVHEDKLDGALERAVKHGFRPCFIAALTTALGLGSLMVSRIVPISKFGMYSALGVMATLLLLFLYLPALLHYFPSRKFAEEHSGKHHLDDKDDLFVRWWRWFGGLVINHNGWVAVGCVLAMVLFGFGVNRMKTSVKLMKLFSPDAEIIAHYGWLEEHLGPLVPTEVVLRVDNQKCKLSFVDRMRLAQTVERAVEQLKDVGGALSAATLAPDIRPKTRKRTVAERILAIDPRRDRDFVLNKRLEPHRPEFHEYLSVDVDGMLTDDPNLKHLRITGKVADALQGEGLVSLSAIQQHGDLASIEGIGPEGAKQVARAIAAWKAARNPTVEQLGITGEIAERLKAKKLNTLDGIERHGEIQYIKGIGPEGAAAVAEAI